MQQFVVKLKYVTKNQDYLVKKEIAYVKKMNIGMDYVVRKKLINLNEIFKIKFNFKLGDRLLYGDYCKLDYACDSKKGLICMNSFCECMDFSSYWNINNKSCGKKYLNFFEL